MVTREECKRIERSALFATDLEKRLARAHMALLDECENLRRGWRPIETAPKVGVVLLWDGKSVQSGWWDANLNGDEAGWTNGACASYSYELDVRVTPTHWRPLPDPPDAVISGNAPNAPDSLASSEVHHAERLAIADQEHAARGGTNNGSARVSRGW